MGFVAVVSLIVAGTFDHDQFVSSRPINRDMTHTHLGHGFRVPLRLPTLVGEAKPPVNPTFKIRHYISASLLVIPFFYVEGVSKAAKMLNSPRQLPYAPTPYSYMPNPALGATINLDEVCNHEPSVDGYHQQD